MNNQIFTWKGQEWQTEERWGDMHPDKPWARYSSDCVKINKKDELELSVGNFVDGAFNMGLVSTTANNCKFSYGTYSFIAKLPRGKNLWPALWMWSWDSWPPELDVMEAWTNKCGGYKLTSGLSHITNCVHWNESNFHKPNFLKFGKLFPFHLPQYTFNVYSMLWKPDLIAFFFNGKMISTFTDKEALEWINNHNKNGMNIIMNLYPTKDYKKGDMKSPLIIRDFHYDPLY